MYLLPAPSLSLAALPPSQVPTLPAPHPGFRPPRWRFGPPPWPAVSSPVRLLRSQRRGGQHPGPAGERLAEPTNPGSLCSHEWPPSLLPLRPLLRPKTMLPSKPPPPSPCSKPSLQQFGGDFGLSRRGPVHYQGCCLSRQRAPASLWTQYLPRLGPPRSQLCALPLPWRGGPPKLLHRRLPVTSDCSAFASLSGPRQRGHRQQQPGRWQQRLCRGRPRRGRPSTPHPKPPSNATVPAPALLKKRPRVPLLRAPLAVRHHRPLATISPTLSAHS
mmetsp:Transcript_125653/g.314020  ORF Transcript_125653/g.314020 Transcript_125653/m.314020 type:complete len:273 (+) Transcript_125653:86-904(+)